MFTYTCIHIHVYIQKSKLWQKQKFVMITFLANTVFSINLVFSLFWKCKKDWKVWILLKKKMNSIICLWT